MTASRFRLGKPRKDCIRQKRQHWRHFQFRSFLKVLAKYPHNGQCRQNSNVESCQSQVLLRRFPLHLVSSPSRASICSLQINAKLHPSLPWTSVARESLWIWTKDGIQRHPIIACADIFKKGHCIWMPFETRWVIRGIGKLQWKASTKIRTFPVSFTHATLNFQNLVCSTIAWGLYQAKWLACSACLVFTSVETFIAQCSLFLLQNAIPAFGFPGILKQYGLSCQEPSDPRLNADTALRFEANQSI